MTRPWLRIAHRGASGSCPEHTRAAFVRALELRVDMIELDVQLSRDGAVVVFHDETLTRTAGVDGAVRDWDLSALRRLDIGRWFDVAFAGATILTLEEVLALVRGRARLNVEIKRSPGDAAALVPRLLRCLRTGGVLESAVVSSFDPVCLGEVRAACPEVAVGLLWQEPVSEDMWAIARSLRARSLHPHWGFVTPDLMERAHAQDLQVLAWTVNDIGVMHTLVEWGIDGVMSDFPERFAAVQGIDA